MERNDGRGYFRVEVRLPIEFRKISRDEYVDLENTVKYGSTQIIDKINEMTFLREVVSESKANSDKGQTYAYLRIIDKKLDMILDLLDKSKDEGLYHKRFTNVNISGAGIRFVSDVDFQEGEHVELKIILPIPPYPKLTSLCEVVRSVSCKKNGVSDWETALNFTTINEEDRDLLINFIFTKEREILRHRKDR